MELELSEDQELFLDTTRKLLAAEVPIPAVRALESDPAGFTPDVLAPRRRARLDLDARARGRRRRLALRARPARPRAGGRGDGPARARPGPLVPVNVVAAAVSRPGSAEQKAAVLPGLLGGDGGGGVDGPDADRRRASTATRSSSPAPRRPVEAGAQAAHLLVVGRTGDGLTQVLVPADAAGLTVTPAGRPRPRAPLRRGRASTTSPCPRRAVVGEVGGAADEVERQLQVAVVLQCAETVRRHRPRLRDDPRVPRRPLLVRPAAVLVPGAQAPGRRREDVAGGLPRHRHRAPPGRWPPAPPTPAELVSAAKAWVGPHATELVQDCVQLHGGIGVTWEHDLHLYLRRATVNRATYGTPEEHAERIATRLLGAAS